MKTLIRTAAVAMALALPIAAFAQSSAPVTRADVRAQLAQLESAGYSPAGDNAHYPTGIEATQARIDSQHADEYGGVIDHTSQAGAAFHPQYDVGLKSIYVGH
ncbi:DUF4148 domain-containing protein [Paraburkholderia sp. Tr-20389]|uniref:DUF4148 domain-containing protein n=1 Tax=Paraburkholderia sp. Tr-20389 TaxID=2703903 RepID=UPI001981FEBA|nr:DUF4148 domain-containing protein [Paraburkholderia sp. Tr-20389]MBN3755530.1 DUF4148 domain-containing protein [Paraburkholderia sp. Tr-20389]